MNRLQQHREAQRQSLVNTNHDLAMPEGLSDLGRRAWRTIIDEALEAGTLYTGGCNAFYSPQAWRERGEEYGCDAELIVVYDGAELKYLFSLDACMATNSYSPVEIMQEKLSEAGLYAQECTGWYSAIYRG